MPTIVQVQQQLNKSRPEYFKLSQDPRGQKWGLNSILDKLNKLKGKR